MSKFITFIYILYTFVFACNVYSMEPLNDQAANKTSMINIGDKDGLAPMHHLIAHTAKYTKEDQIAVLNLLIEHNADVNVQCKNIKFTPLHYATYDSRHHLIQPLLTAQADITIKDYVGRTPLVLAIQSGNVEAIKLLLTYQNQ